VATGAIGVVGVALPYTPVGAAFGLVPLAPAAMGLLLTIAITYATTVEAVKRLLFERLSRR